MRSPRRLLERATSRAHAPKSDRTIASGIHRSPDIPSRSRCRGLRTGRCDAARYGYRCGMTAAEMLKSHPDLALDPDALVSCVDAARQATSATTACADACLAEDDVAAMRTCIRRCLDTADVAATTAAVLSRQ